MPNILNELTNLEIEAIRLARKKEDRNCLACDKAVKMKAGQNFCSPACRVRWSREQARILYEQLVKEKENWLREREELVKEIAELKRAFSGRG